MSEGEAPKKGVSRRAAIQLGVFGAAAALGGGYTVASCALHVERTSVARLGLSRPLRLALISDLHAPHFWFGMEALREAVNAADVDVVAVLGDVVDEAANAGLVPTLLAGLNARQAKVAIAGNWEYWARVPMDTLAADYADLGFKLLINEALVVRAGEQEVALIGLDDLLGGAPRFNMIEEARAGRPAIVLSHCPETVASIAAAVTAPTVVFSGHTHGGQLAPLGWVVWTPPGSGDYVAGWYPGLGPAGTCDLYVSRGLGCSKLSLRLGSGSTLDLVELG